MKPRLLALALVVFGAGSAIAGYDYCQAPLPEYVAPVPGSGAELVQVAVVSRHGDRSPLAALPHEAAEASGSDAKWDCGIRELNRLVSVDGETDPAAEFAMSFADVSSPSSGALSPYSARFWKGNCTVG
jgi:hypothetical protein